MSLSKFIIELQNAKLRQGYENLVDAGEEPYSENLRAMHEFDINDDAEAGQDALIVMLDGIDLWIEQLESFADAADRISESAVSIR